MKDKKNIVNHAIALGILLVGFFLCRYIFFDIHGMKEFPKVLLILGLVVMAISELLKKKILPYFISSGYIVGFVFGFIFQVTKIDTNGVSVNNLWVIWAVVNVIFIAVGVHLLLFGILMVVSRYLSIYNKLTVTFHHFNI